MGDEPSKPTCSDTAPRPALPGLKVQIGEPSGSGCKSPRRNRPALDTKTDESLRPNSSRRHNDSPGLTGLANGFHQCGPQTDSQSLERAKFLEVGNVETNAHTWTVRPQGKLDLATLALRCSAETSHTCQAHLQRIARIGFESLLRSDQDCLDS